MKKTLVVAAAVFSLPLAAQAQSLQPGGVYIGAEGGLNWMLNSTFTGTLTVPPFGSASTQVNANYNTLSATTFWGLVWSSKAFTAATPVP